MDRPLKKSPPKKGVSKEDTKEEGDKQPTSFKLKPAKTGELKKAITKGDFKKKVKSEAAIRRARSKEEKEKEREAKRKAKQEKRELKRKQKEEEKLRKKQKKVCRGDDGRYRIQDNI